MERDLNRLEFERVKNLVTAFHWEVIKEEIQDEDIVLVIRKNITIEVVILPSIEKDRLRNLVESFGWYIFREESQDEWIVVSMRKKRPSPFQEGTQGIG